MRHITLLVLAVFLAACDGSAPTPEAAWLAADQDRHVGAQAEIRRQLGALPLGRLHLDRRWTLEAQVENLFDKDYETAGGFQAPPRIAYLGLRYSRLP